MARAVILGTGAIGYALARRLLAAGWRVDVTVRDPRHLAPELEVPGARFTVADRDDIGAIALVLASSACSRVSCAKCPDGRILDGQPADEVTHRVLQSVYGLRFDGVQPRYA